MKTFLVFCCVLFTTYSIGQISIINDENIDSLPSFKVVRRSDLFELYENLKEKANGYNQELKVLLDDNMIFQYGSVNSENGVLYTNYFNSDSKLVRYEAITPFNQETWAEDVARLRNASENYEFEELTRTDYEYQILVGGLSPSNVREKAIGIVEEGYRASVDWVDGKASKYLLKVGFPIFKKNGKKTSKVDYLKIEVREPANQSSDPLTQYEELSQLIDTKFSYGDLKDLNLIYDIKLYLLMFLEELTVKELQDRKVEHWLAGGSFFENSVAKDLAVYLNEDDTEFLKELINDDRIIVEYKDLDDGVLALSIGNVFNGDDFKIIIDPINFEKASPEKRAFIIWHEGYHSLGLNHGECGKLMFPYADRDYDWVEWAYETAITFDCFIKNRNSLKELVLKSQN